jgi:hypothetical protein
VTLLSHPWCLVFRSRLKGINERPWTGQ